MNRLALAERLARCCRTGEESALADLARELGFTEPKKTVANLLLLQESFQDCALLADIILATLPSADPDLALNNLERLLATVPGTELTAVLTAPTARSHLLTILGASPFLTGILCRRGEFFHDLFAEGELDRNKDETTMLAELQQLIPAGSSFAELQRGLRRYKGREILRIGSRDLCGLAQLREVTGELSALAAAALQRALEISEELLRAEFGAPLLDEPAGAEGEFTVLGMGKLGGRELNFSSDIDLLYFYSSERGTTAGRPDPLGERRHRIPLHTYYIKLAEMLTRAIGQATEDGFVFRVDLRLRPDGNSGEMANSLRGGEVYYESWGQSWERAAMIKARPVAGSIPLGERLLKALEPFVYRRYLDYGMLEDIKGMKQKIDRSLTREQEGELNLKLGRGGIREIEFFIQALQLIYGGKNPLLRERNSLRALELLQREGLVKACDQRLLHDAYTFLRTVEHRIQVVQERQTHALPIRPEEIRALARRCGFADEQAFRSALEGHRQGVAGIFHDLFYSEEECRDEVRPEIAFMFERGADVDLVKDMLEEKGFRNPDGAYDCLLTLRDGPAHSHLTQRARRHLERIAPLLLQEVLDSPEPDMAILNLERFLSALRARATFFALLAENRQILKILISLFATSQFLSRIFIQHPEVLDSLVSRSYAVFLKDRAAMAKELTELLSMAGDYEEKLEVLRRYRKEEFLRIAMSDLHGHMAQEEGTMQLSALAEVCLQQALDIARDELLPRFGLPWSQEEDGRESPTAFAIVGMGKLGGQEINYHSDLDIIFIYQGEGETRAISGADASRFRPLSNQEYFSKLAQRTISILTLMTREGYVYQIDTRLRPSGNQGPLVTSLAAYLRYHQASAQPWERQALAKARVVVGPDDFARSIGEINCRIVYLQPLPADLRMEIFRLRLRMETEIAREGSEHFNIKTGRGGMVDVEFIAQYLQLLHGRSRPKLRQANTLAVLRALREEELLGERDYLVLDSGYRFLRRLENRLRLVHDQSINELSGERTYLVKLARRLGYPDKPRRPDEVFLEEYRAVTDKIRGVFDELLGPQPGDSPPT